MFVGFETHKPVDQVDPISQRDRDELGNREQIAEALVDAREKACQAFRDSEEAVTKFNELVATTGEALNARKRTPEQNQALVLLNDTISTIDLTNMDALTPEQRRQGQTAAHLVELNKQVEENRKLWNAATKEVDENQSFIKRIRDRLSNGQTTELAVHGNHVNFIPCRENLSMFEDTTSQMRSVWALLEGEALLDLKFYTLKNSLAKLRRSVADDLLQMETGNLQDYF